MSKGILIDHILPLVKKPGRYIGGELHCADKSWDEAQVRFALVFPDLYEIGMSHQGLQILYHCINSREEMLAERCFAPDIDMEEELRRHELPLFSLESRTPLGNFDAIGITLPYELSYTNILTILNLSSIPFRAEQRSENFPLIIGGGSCGLNPEPVSDFFDAIVLGDGEEVILEIAGVVLDAKKNGATRQEVLSKLSDLAGVYVPSFFVPHYNGSELTAIQPLKQGYTAVRRRVLSRLPGPEEIGKPLVPVVKPVHDRLGLEIARGCTRGCRFCQAGIIYRPVRERPVEDILAIADQGIQNSGFHEMALLSLSSGDFTCLPDLIVRLMDRFADQYISVSMPSMRVGTLTPEVMNQIKRVRKTGFTVAPEAGTDRLREVINKGITEEDLLETCRNAFAMGWNLIKFYFMIGLPTETWEDVEAIVELARKARETAGTRAKRVQVNVSVGTFVPKPHTPFQWERQLTLEEAQERINRLKRLLPRRGFKLKWHDPQQSVMEGVFSRGDRRLAQLIETAWQNGVRLDGWSEHFRLERWQQAADQCGIDLDSYLRERDSDKLLPWDHLESGVSREFLVQERMNAPAGKYTPDCRTEGCQQCGLCDFKILRPVVNKQAESSWAVTPKKSAGKDEIKREQGECHTYRAHYVRTGDTRFYSHLEILQLIFRVLVRAGIRVLYSQGYNPTPRVSFSSALPVGIESEAEYFDIELATAIGDIENTIERLNRELPDGMKVFTLEPSRKTDTDAQLASYSVHLHKPLLRHQQESVSDFLTRQSFVIERIRKNKTRELDIRPLVKDIRAEGNNLAVELISYHGKAGTSPREILQHVVGLADGDALLARIKKTRVVDFLSIT
ncbi:MAG: TIGR03960 family B12-binding radical SAM protein [Desulfobulbaceae bacterium]|nr:TIGR03960 family B12-binding radical SAM protein [Desulfobulbaceae bacterium]